MSLPRYVNRDELNEDGTLKSPPKPKKKAAKKEESEDDSE